MAIKDPYLFDPPRPNFEMGQAAIRLGAALGFGTWGLLSSLPSEPFCLMGAAFGAMGLLKVRAAQDRYRRNAALAGSSLHFCTFEDLKQRLSVKEHQTDQWIGDGFAWTPDHCQGVHDILKKDWESLAKESLRHVHQWRYLRGHWADCLAHPLQERARCLAQGRRVADQIGQPWIHGLGALREDGLYQPLRHTDGHTLIIGTTGSGKTRCFDLLISQAVLRGETVVILDPKGDRELMENAREACRQLGRERDFMSFHPAHPESSVHIDFLDNWSDPSDVASRIANLIQVSGQGQTFKDFAWDSLNKVCQALVTCSSKPTLMELRHYLEGDLTGITVRTLSAWVLKTHGQAELSRIFAAKEAYSSRNGSPEDAKAIALCNFYRANGPVSPVMDGIVSLYQHDREHFGKMITTLLPVLSMLTSGHVGRLLSPTAGSAATPITTLEMLRRRAVVYIGLNNLSNPMVGSAIGSLALSTLAADAGGRYNFAPGEPPVNVFVDEASEIINENFIQILNKGRGARFRLYVATQTFSDFAARLGSREKACQALGNLNNVISLRCIDPDTQEFVCSRFPKTKIRSIQHTQAVTVSAGSAAAQSGNIAEQLKEEEAELFPAQLLGMLPNLEFIACLSGGSLVKGRYPILVKKLPSEKRGEKN